MKRIFRLAWQLLSDKDGRTIFLKKVGSFCSPLIWLRTLLCLARLRRERKTVFQIVGGLNDQVCYGATLLEASKNRPDLNFVVDCRRLVCSESTCFGWFSWEDFNEKFIRNIPRDDDAVRRKFELASYRFPFEKFQYAVFPQTVYFVFRLIGRLVRCVDWFSDSSAPTWVYFWGYQSRQYDLSQSIKQCLIPVEPAMDEGNVKFREEIDSEEHSICMHIRHGDYCTDGKHVKADYYNKALRQILDRTGWKRAKVFVFSDDMPWAKSKISFAVPDAEVEAGFVEVNSPNEPIPEMELMRRCHHFIGSRGNFAWLAHQLCTYDDKILVRPTVDDQETIDAVVGTYKISPTYQGRKC